MKFSFWTIMASLTLLGASVWADDANVSKTVGEICALEAEASAIPNWDKGLQACARAYMKTFSPEEIKTVVANDIQFRKKIMALSRQQQEILRAYQTSPLGKKRLEKQKEFSENLKEELMGKDTLPPAERAKLIQEIRDDLIKNPIQLNESK